jgi:UDP-N-acetyl-D-mannosaminuronate dehydrogenase
MIPLARENNDGMLAHVPASIEEEPGKRHIPLGEGKMEILGVSYLENRDDKWNVPAATSTRLLRAQGSQFGGTLSCVGL